MESAKGRNRTDDTSIFSAVLYQLSYLGVCPNISCLSSVVKTFLDPALSFTHYLFLELLLGRGLFNGYQPPPQCFKIFLFVYYFSPMLQIISARFLYGSSNTYLTIHLFDYRYSTYLCY